jgi:hypothetical protein
MSDDDRGPVSPFRGLIAGVLVMSFVIVSGMIGDWRSDVGAAQNKAERTAYAMCEEGKDCDQQALRLQARELVSTEATLQILFYQTIFSLVGVIGLGLTVYFAYKAWREAQRSVKVANLTLAADQRPWLSLKAAIGSELKKESTHRGVAGFYLDTHAIIKNHGRAPATNVSYHAEIGILGPGSGSLEKMLNAFMRKAIDRGVGQGIAVFGGEESRTSHVVFLAQNDIDQAIDRQSFKMISACVMGCVNYQSGHTEGIRQTGVLAMLVWAGEGGSAQVIQPDLEQWWRRPVFIPGPFTNIAT